MPSSSRSARSLIGGNWIPSSSCSGWFQAAPSPSSQPPVRDLVHGDGFGCQHRRVAIGDTRYQGAEPDGPGQRCQAGEQRPSLEARSLRVVIERLEMVKDPAALEARLLCELKALDDLFP